MSFGKLLREIRLDPNYLACSRKSEALRLKDLLRQETLYAMFVFDETIENDRKKRCKKF